MNYVSFKQTLKMNKRWPWHYLKTFNERMIKGDAGRLLLLPRRAVWDPMGDPSLQRGLREDLQNLRQVRSDPKHKSVLWNQKVVVFVNVSDTILSR